MVALVVGSDGRPLESGHVAQDTTAVETNSHATTVPVTRGFPLHSRACPVQGDVQGVGDVARCPVLRPMEAELEPLQQDRIRNPPPSHCQLQPAAASSRPKPIRLPGTRSSVPPARGLGFLLGRSLDGTHWHQTHSARAERRAHAHAYDYGRMAFYLRLS